VSEDEPKIFVDEGWKAQVEREREEARKKAEAEASAQGAEGEGEAQAAPAVGEGEMAAEGEQPAPDEAPETPFDILVATLATQTMMALGLIGAPGAQQVMVNLDEAQVHLDMLDALREKTQGNLTAEESGRLDQALSELQRVFTARVQQYQEQAMNQPGLDPNNLKPPQ